MTPGAEQTDLTGVGVLVTGGAGYIGSHTALALIEAGCRVVVVDNLSTGQRDLVPDAATFIEADVGNAQTVADAMRRHDIAAVIHFAGSIIVPESIDMPLKYYGNNTCVTRQLIENCIQCGVRQFVFSSTAAVYGAPQHLPVAEDAPTLPMSPYGTSKLVSEWILRDVAAAHDLRYAALRYFNVAGADPGGRSGQASPGATHLIKVASEAVVGRRDHIDIFGNDYDTPDGTCIRDYIHVSDLAAIHVDGLRYLRAGGPNLTINCGYGRGYSVREILEVVQRASDNDIDIRTAPRRPGDPPVLVADVSRLTRTLRWRPRFDDVNLIVGTALAWERRMAERRQH